GHAGAHKPCLGFPDHDLTPEQAAAAKGRPARSSRVGPSAEAALPQFCSSPRKTRFRARHGVSPVHCPLPRFGPSSIQLGARLAGSSIAATSRLVTCWCSGKSISSCHRLASLRENPPLRFRTIRRPRFGRSVYSRRNLARKQPVVKTGGQTELSTVRSCMLL